MGEHKNPSHPFNVAFTKSGDETISGDEDYDLKYSIEKVEPFLTLPLVFDI
jgi:hypothetical protein